MQSHGDDENWIDEEDDELIEVIDWKEIISLCERLEKSCIQEADSDSGSLAAGMELPRQLRKFRAQMQRLQNKKLKQVRIENLLV